ncbi:hypothetical protein EF834_04930 [Rhodococcus spongiicola]|uniref:Uncharacterized protein n=1 Tax=Rhodococcus spongiicola TaxID=2487352 RepID=A0A3S3ABX6_9NOCA|nr:hypothetical protein EF834_04930 [Rhodococcus spongiicola]
MLQQYVDVAGFVPKSFSETEVVPYDIPATRRDQIMAARMGLPSPFDLAALGLNPWTNFLDMAGFGDQIRRTSRGINCRADDGHWCLSLFECEIDNFLTRNGIAHEHEPHWPKHPTLNKRGRRRADWKLADGTMIEAAGLMSVPTYQAKMAEKRLLADEFGIRLIVIEPSDLRSLHVVFREWIGESAMESSKNRAEVAPAAAERSSVNTEASLPKGDTNRRAHSPQESVPTHAVGRGDDAVVPRGLKFAANAKRPGHRDTPMKTKSARNPPIHRRETPTSHVRRKIAIQATAKPPGVTSRQPSAADRSDEP